MRKTAILFSCALGCLLAACGNPSDPEGWAKRAVGRSRLDEKLQALAEVRKAPGDRNAAVPHLIEVLKQAPRARAQAAVALGEIRDQRAVKPLVDALDGSSRDREVQDANRHIADALGAIGAKEAVPALQALLSSRDGYVQVAAVDALGRIGDPAAVDTLIAIATGKDVEPFTAKKALLALGRIADPRAAPIILRMLFDERPGVSFFPEAAFAATQIGSPMGAPLLAILEGKDPETAGWAKERGVVQGALFAKSAQLLGDVGGPDSIPALVAKLNYNDADPGIEMYVRVLAAESLGRMRAKEAVRTLSDLASRERDPDVRDRYCDALARIGDPSALPALKAAAASGSWDLREGPLTAISRLGGEPERAFIAAAREKECANGCAPAIAAAYALMDARLGVAAACSDVACWAAKLGDANAGVRDRAALEVGRAGGAAHAAALGEAIVRQVSDEADVAGRYHAVLALDWIGRRERLGAPGDAIAAKIDAVIAADRGRTLTARVNEDALRLATRLHKGASQ